jgi:hypothetical protein
MEAPFAWKVWFATVATGEAVGFAIPVAIWAIAWKAGLPPFALYAAVVAAGAGEGAVLGLAQARNIEAYLPGITRPWVVRTAVAAAFAWAFGMAPSTLADLGAPTWIPLTVISIGAIPVLLAIGVAQWSLLRERLPHSRMWISANAVAWLAGLPSTLIAPALVPDGAPWYAWAIAFSGAGIAMAATVAAITGAAMKSLLAAAGRP